MSLEGQFKALEGQSAVDIELQKMKGLVSSVAVRCSELWLFLQAAGPSSRVFLSNRQFVHGGTRILVFILLLLVLFVSLIRVLPFNNNA